MAYVRESFNPHPMAADTAFVVKGSSLAGFLAKASGTITVTSKDSLGTSDVTLVDAVPVTAGLYTPLPLGFPTGAGGTVTLAGGAAGTLFT